MFEFFVLAIGESKMLGEMWQVTPDAAPVNPADFRRTNTRRFARVLIDFY
jgi:hypothetical protein